MIRNIDISRPALYSKLLQTQLLPSALQHISLCNKPILIYLVLDNVGHYWFLAYEMLYTILTHADLEKTFNPICRHSQPFHPCYSPCGGFRYLYPICVSGQTRVYNRDILTVLLTKLNFIRRKKLNVVSDLL